MSDVILFDLDGTLTDSGPGIIKCVQYALNYMGKPESNPENLRCFVGPPLHQQFMEYGALPVLRQILRWNSIVSGTAP